MGVIQQRCEQFNQSGCVYMETQKSSDCKDFLLQKNSLRVFTDGQLITFAMNFSLQRSADHN